MNLLLKKLNNLINYIETYIIEKIIKCQKSETVPNTLLMIKVDAIGDYVLFRNFLQAVKESKIFSNYKITLCGNIAWKELAESLDSKFVNKFVWLDRGHFYNSFTYRYRFLKGIYQTGYETAIYPTYSREILYGDTIIKASQSKKRIGSAGSMERHAKWKRSLFTDSVYTKRIKTSRDNIFEFYRNKEFFEELLGEKVRVSRPFIDTTGILLPEEIREKLDKGRFIVLVPGAGISYRRWSIDNFVKTANFILDNYEYDIVISGSKEEGAIANEIMNKLNSSRVFNLAGHLKLSQLARLLSEAALLISNETSTVHFAAAVNTPVICISNGSFKGRFHPYPDEVFLEAYYIYPPEIENALRLKDTEEKYRYISDIDVNSIKPARVIEKIREILKK
ncbi:MAG: glycosyltransferase family 9 protein [Bacteroidota bacterium]|nr:glycosyltransferase family 9 protein [Bacteroidota bacterium]